MNCTQCHNPLKADHQFCLHCGKSTSNANPEGGAVEKKSWLTPKRVIGLLIVFSLFTIAPYKNANDTAVRKNNEAQTMLSMGKKNEAIDLLLVAKSTAKSKSVKTSILKNLGYAYNSKNDVPNSIKSFKEALETVKKDSFQYYLISGEIAKSENRPQDTIANFEKAYALKPNDFQINNSLNIFYLNVDDTHPELIDYEKALFHAKKAYEYDSEKLYTTSQNLAAAHYFNENYDECIALFSESNLDYHPDVALWMGFAYLNKGDDANARLYFQKAQDMGVELPDNARAYMDELNLET